jgi:nicotinamidase-related amidase
MEIFFLRRKCGSHLRGHAKDVCRRHRLANAVASPRPAERCRNYSRASGKDNLYSVYPGSKNRRGAGMWRHYYERWRSMTVEKLGADMLEIAPDLAHFVPPARTLDKSVYSPWIGSDLHQRLRSANVDTVIITGGETDVCVLATMLGAIDWGVPRYPHNERTVQLRRRDPRRHDEYLHEPLRRTSGMRHHRHSA